MESVGSRSLDATISLDTTTPDLDRGELGDVATGGLGDIVARVSETSGSIGGGVGNSNGNAILLTNSKVSWDVDVASGVAKSVVVAHGSVVVAIDVIVGILIVLGAELGSMTSKDSATARVGAKADTAAGTIEVGADVGLSIASVSKARSANGGILDVGAVLVREDTEANDVDIRRVEVSDIRPASVFAGNTDGKGTFDVLTSISDVGGRSRDRASVSDVVVIRAEDRIASVGRIGIDGSGFYGSGINDFGAIVFAVGGGVLGRIGANEVAGSIGLTTDEVFVANRPVGTSVVGALGELFGLTGEEEIVVSGIVVGMEGSGSTTITGGGEPTVGSGVILAGGVQLDFIAIDEAAVSARVELGSAIAGGAFRGALRIDESETRGVVTSTGHTFITPHLGSNGIVTVTVDRWVEEGFVDAGLEGAGANVGFVKARIGTSEAMVKGKGSIDGGGLIGSGGTRAERSTSGIDTGSGARDIDVVDLVATFLGFGPERVSEGDTGGGGGGIGAIIASENGGVARTAALRFIL